MGNCSSPANSIQSQQLQVTLVALGLNNAGKTTIANHFLKDPDWNVAPTVGFDNDSFTRRNFECKVFGLGGGASFRGVWDNYYSDAHGIIFVIDSADRARMEEMKQVFTKVAADKRVDGKPLLIYANKQDLPAALSPDELSLALNLVALPQSPYKIVQTIAKFDPTSPDPRHTTSDPKIIEGLDWLLDRIQNNYKALSERVVAEIIEQKKVDAERKKAQADRVAKDRAEREAREKQQQEAEQLKSDSDHSGSPSNGESSKRPPALHVKIDSNTEPTIHPFGSGSPRTPVISNFLDDFEAIEMPKQSPPPITSDNEPYQFKDIESPRFGMKIDPAPEVPKSLESFQPESLAFALKVEPPTPVGQEPAGALPGAVDE